MLPSLAPWVGRQAGRWFKSLPFSTMGAYIIVTQLLSMGPGFRISQCRSVPVLAQRQEGQLPSLR